MSELLVPLRKKVQHKVSDNPLRDAIAGGAFPVLQNVQRGACGEQNGKEVGSAHHQDYLGVAPPSGRPENPDKKDTKA